jgi:hypothetical protein
MCGVCGSLGGEEHWSSGAGRILGDSAPTRRAERAKRIRVINRALLPLRVTVSDWQGRLYLVAGATGKQMVVDSLPHIWQAAQEITGRNLDPLAPPITATAVAA